MNRSATFLRFVIVGLANTGFGYLVYAGLTLAGMPAQPALALSFCIGVLWNYLTSARFVFRVRGMDRLPAYVLCYLGVYGANALALHGMLSAGIAPLWAQALLTPPTAVLSFLLLSRVMTGTGRGRA